MTRRPSQRSCGVVRLLLAAVPLAGCTGAQQLGQADDRVRAEQPLVTAAPVTMPRRETAPTKARRTTPQSVTRQKAHRRAAGWLLRLFRGRLCKTPGVTPERPVGFYSRDRWPKRQVVLTFDDGPLHRMTERILDVLKRHRLQATFFVVGAMIHSGSFRTIQRILREGHILANHSYHHRTRMVKHPRAREVILRELQLNQAIVDVALLAESPAMFRKLRKRLLGGELRSRFPERLLQMWPVVAANWRGILRELGPGGRSPYQMVYVRPPGGYPFYSRVGAKYKRIFASAVQELGLVTVLWSSMSTDSCPWLPKAVRRDPVRVAGSIIRGAHMGGVLLMHDWMNHRHLGLALDAMAKSKRYQVVSLDSLARRKFGCSPSWLSYTVRRRAVRERRVPARRVAGRLPPPRPTPSSLLPAG